MKNILFLIVALFMILLLIGCQTESNQGESEQEEENIQEPVEEESVKEEEVEDREGEIELDVTVNEHQPLYRVNQTNWAIEPISEETNSQVVLLTIDDAPDQHALEMANTLKTLEAPAIFFVNGHFLQDQEQQQILKEIYEMGFVIGNHTYTHPNLSDLSEEQQREEIIALNDLVEDIIGERPKFFRAPFGVNTDVSNAVAEEEEMVVMNWTYGYDWEADYTEADALAEIMVNAPELRDGANVLMHDRAWTREALEDIVIGLREKDYEIVNPKTIETVSE
ncbi:polysaccharide deacetylase family protein [Amphibacillus cookii]|uniref:polysaccharide deacetylase family protein n=1 Tax=Amphibacillus cookii TaxID=767787 RepID=UPI00195659C3|nr:polysaccharide deacetylase family protein [Amphibacillus cookii]MBM7540440.1 peptidoglycan/xylan/chitin deacetylase (PgdA/CDA1 family) [Amphibacillus cookii]